MNLAFGVLFAAFGLAVPLDGAKILGIFPMASYSHYILGHSLFDGLARSGHQVTLISAYNKTTIPNYTNLYLDGVKEQMEEMQREKMQKSKVTPNDMRNISPFLMLPWMGEMTLALNDLIFQHPKVKELMKEKFDLVILEQFVNDGLKVFCVHFDVPCVAFSTIGAGDLSNYLVSNPAIPSYMPSLFLPYSSDMTFFQRVHNTIFTAYAHLVNRFLLIPRQEAGMKKYFPEAPGINEIIDKHIDLLFLNSHVSINNPVPVVPQVVEVGGIHVNPNPNKLPSNIKKFLDDAKEGVVYFSLGSNVQSKDLPKEMLHGIMAALSKLKLKVLWKFENSNLEGKPKNVMIQDWLPQQEVLGHPNVKIFLTHGGLLSSIEAVYFGVPLIGVPFFGDQRANMQMHVKNGFALQIDFDDLNEASLTEAFNSILIDSKFAKEAKRRSTLMRDRLVPPIELAVYWIEYLLRNGNVDFMKTAARTLSWYQYLLLDVMALFIFITVAPILLICKLCRCRKAGKCCKNKQNKKNKRD